MHQKNKVPTLGGVMFHHRGAFWFGVIAVTLGVIAHIPMYMMGQSTGYRLVGMPMDIPMTLGMFAIIIGLIASFYGLYPDKRSTPASTSSASKIRVKALDDAKIGAAHITLLFAMAVAVTIDIMKPTALAFVMPGMAVEYGLKSPLNPTGTIPVVYVALSGITGTVLGSFMWGDIGDRIGRRASILFAGIVFIGTSICGAMPDFFWNLGMCFLMGIGVGGMLPICYALLAETIPARHRSWLMILIGADIAGAYILTSWLAAELVPTYSWRILWLIGLPTGVLFIMLNRWIPESPRFLLAQGRDAEAQAIMERYGAVITEEEAPPRLETPLEEKAGWRHLFNRELWGLTLAICCLSIGSGLVLFGFNLWIPTNLRKLGFTEADAILRNAALIGLPMTFLVAWMYGFWSSKKTIIVLSCLTAAALFGFAAFQEQVLHNRALLYVLLVIPIWGINSVVAVLSVYSSEIYPTHVRSRGTGLAAGLSKMGGVLIITLVALSIAPPSISTVSLIGAIPMAMAVFAIVIFGVETRKRRLEEITADEMTPYLMKL